MTIRILAAGDLHLGRRPTRVLDPAVAEKAATTRMWESIVQEAIAQQVDAVLLSGDIVHQQNRYYEATGPLEQGLRRLAAAQIETFAVAGNHDWDVFPRILRQLDLPRFHFLGRDGQWQSADLTRDGQPILRIWGWSFPQQHYHLSPLAERPEWGGDSLPTIGLLHADVDVSNSRYAPVALRDLQSSGLTAWVLGHVHRPQYWESGVGSQVLYPGSPQALDPGETGIHGPWLLELEGHRLARCQQLALSIVRYEAVDVQLQSVADQDEFDNRIHGAISQALQEYASERSPLRMLLLRLRLGGATGLAGRIGELTAGLRDLQRKHLDSDVIACVEDWIDQTRPAIDLKQLAGRNDPAGLLASLLMELEADGESPTLQELLRQALPCLEEVYRASTYQPVSSQPPDRGLARDLLLRQGWKLLDALQAQRTTDQGVGP